MTRFDLPIPSSSPQRGIWTALLATLIAVNYVPSAVGLPPLSPEWIRQFGGNGIDTGRSVSADTLGNVYVSGHVEGAPIVVSLGGRDAFLQKYDSAGNASWTRQFGTSNHDSSWGVEADGLGNVYVVGETLGVLGAASLGDQDAYLRKYDTFGNVLWTSQFGTSNSDQALKASVDGLDNVYVAGQTRGSLGGLFLGGDSDAFVRKYTSAGTALWSRQLGSSGTDVAEGLAADSLGNVFIGGRTSGSITGVNVGSWDAFIAKYDLTGNLVWTAPIRYNG